MCRRSSLLARSLDIICQREVGVWNHWSKKRNESHQGSVGTPRRLGAVVSTSTEAFEHFGRARCAQRFTRGARQVGPSRFFYSCGVVFFGLPLAFGLCAVRQSCKFQLDDMRGIGGPMKVPVS